MTASLDTLDTPTHAVPGYRTLLRLGGPGMVLTSAASRIPGAMLPLGLLLYVVDRTDSYASAGLVVGALSIGGGLGGVAVGALADRFGQRRVVLAATAIQVLALAGLLFAPTRLVVFMLLAAAAGIANPQPGAMARVRWRGVERRTGRRLQATALAWEGAVDEASFVIGPVLVGTAAGLVSPTAALTLTLALAAVLQTAFACHRSAAGAARPTSEDRAERERIARPAAFLVVLAMFGVGMVFGSSQTGVAARLDLGGTGELIGIVYGCMGIGAAMASIATTRIPARITPVHRVALGGLGIALSGVLLTLAGSPIALAAACLCTGLAVGPTLVSSYSIAAGVAPARRITAMMSALATGNVIGVAAGAAVAGQLIEHSGPAPALAVVCAAGLLAFTAARGLRRVS